MDKEETAPHLSHTNCSFGIQRWPFAQPCLTERLLIFPPCWSDYSNGCPWDGVIRPLLVNGVQASLMHCFPNSDTAHQVTAQAVVFTVQLRHSSLFNDIKCLHKNYCILLLFSPVWLEWYIVLFYILQPLPWWFLLLVRVGACKAHKYGQKYIMVALLTLNNIFLATLTIILLSCIFLTVASWCYAEIQYEALLCGGESQVAQSSLAKLFITGMQMSCEPIHLWFQFESCLQSYCVRPLFMLKNSLYVKDHRGIIALKWTSFSTDQSNYSSFRHFGTFTRRWHRSFKATVRLKMDWNNERQYNRKFIPRNDNVLFW